MASTTNGAGNGGGLPGNGNGAPAAPAHPDPQRIAVLAKRVDEAARNASPIAQFAEAEGVGEAEAYAIQAASIARRLHRG